MRRMRVLGVKEPGFEKQSVLSIFYLSIYLLPLSPTKANTVQFVVSKFTLNLLVVQNIYHARCCISKTFNRKPSLNTAPLISPSLTLHAIIIFGIIEYDYEKSSVLLLQSKPAEEC